MYHRLIKRYLNKNMCLIFSFITYMPGGNVLINFYKNRGKQFQHI